MRNPFSLLLRCGAGLVLLASAGCIDAYLPDVINTPNKYLVVDGFINGNGVTRIKLSRTENISATTAPPVETKATIFILDDAGGRYALRESSAGFYKSDSVVLNPARQYQLRITTSGTGAATYESGLVPLKVTPPIDKLAWQLFGSQVDILVSAHDNTQQSRFYRWQFVETWEFNAAYLSKLEYFPNRNPYRRRLDRRVTPIYTCWRTEQPTTIKQTSTLQLSQDAVTDFAALSISNRAERLKIRYSVLVKQYTETAQEFAYYELLRKNTEAVGGVNDPLPSQLTGNVHRVDNASEPVLGWVGAHTVQQQRLFIAASQLPLRNDADYDSPYTACIAAPLYFCIPYSPCDEPGVINLFANPLSVPLDSINDAGGRGILGANTDCADCRTRGTTTKPSFW